MHCIWSSAGCLPRVEGRFSRTAEGTILTPQRGRHPAALVAEDRRLRSEKEETVSTVSDRKFDELKARFEGEILLPGDGGYDSARQIWNAMIDKRPAVIARCATTSDVVRGVNFARENGLLLAIRGGG